MSLRNILWIMCDQLRFDYLSCYGHPHLRTPNIDALAARGTRFSRAYVQSPVCGPSRMSYYTGRYMRSHGSNWNRFPLRVGEPTLGDALREIGVRPALVGKTHMAADHAGLRRLGIDPRSQIGVHASECGFEPYERDDGLHPDGSRQRPRYEQYLAERGYPGDNPWQNWANSAEDEQGNLLSGWLLENADKPARLRAEDSETPYMTRRAMDFIREAQAEGGPWLCHLSYIKPHWPYIAPAPYHEMYGADDLLPVLRDEIERRDPHPVYAAFLQHRLCKTFQRDEVRRRVLPAYMGLIGQIDEQIGELMQFVDEQGLSDDTMIVFSSDHGDYLGDHWLGEKDLFHEQAVKVPLIVVDPRNGAARGAVCDALVEGIDLAPTFVEALGGEPPNAMEGRSLLPLLRGEQPGGWRPAVFSEYDYSMQQARVILDQPIRDCRLYMVFDGRWKYIHASGFRPMLYDLQSDPEEFHDLGADPAREAQRQRLSRLLLDWALSDHNRITTSDERIAGYDQLASGVLIGYWDEAEVEAERRRRNGGG